MAQVFVTKHTEWYQAIAGLNSYNEKELEGRFLKYAIEVFQDYFMFQSAYTFINKLDESETSAPDIVLISKDFQEWRIVELELVGKGLKHTRKQLRVFTNPKFEIPRFTQHCIEKCPILKSHELELSELLKKTPEVLVVFDNYQAKTLDPIRIEFKNARICVFEIYKTAGHTLELYRISGEYPYIKTKFTLLKPRGFYTYELHRSGFFPDQSKNEVEVWYEGMKYKSKVSWATKSNVQKCYLNIDNNPFPPDKLLMLEESLSGAYYLKTT